MSIPVATALGRRDRMWPAVVVSAVAHAVLIVVALVRVPAPEIDLQQKPIVAKLVRLGEKRPEQYLPRKEEAPPPPAPAAPAPIASPGPAPQPHAVAIAKPDPKPAPKATSPRPSTSKGTGTSLASVLSKVQKQVNETQWGAPDGDPSGDSETGEEGDRYLALVTRELHSNYTAPNTISERDRLHLKGTVVLYIDPDGRIARWQLETPSGNAAFDAALERAVRATRRLPPPPDGLKDVYRRGLVVNFTAAAG
jgi:colicin import membrane protein/protein TonB